MDCDQIVQMLQQRIGFDPKVLNQRLLRKVLEQRQAACQVKDLSRYYHLLQTSPTELTELIEQLVIPETWFFRDRKPFDFLVNFGRSEGRTIAKKGKLRLLSVPCSTGEEPYSIAIALLEAGLLPAQFRIDAIDISHVAIAKAQRATYGKNSFRGQEWGDRQRYFQSSGEKLIVSPAVQSTVHFQPGNLLTVLSNNQHKYDVIFCRNLLIYLDQSVLAQVFSTFHRLLRPQGFLFVGAAETAKVPKQQFVSIGESFTFAYRKVEPSRSIPSATSQPQIPIPVVPSTTSTAFQSVPRSQPSPQPGAQLSIAPNQPIAFQNIQDLANAGDLNAAIRHCQVYLAENPANVEAHNLLGTLYNATSNYQEAESWFQKAIYLQPDHYEALMHLALIKASRGDTLAATRLQKRIQKINA
jgi:chemotaxis protein methyltransferase WspC